MKDKSMEDLLDEFLEDLKKSIVNVESVNEACKLKVTHQSLVDLKDYTSLNELKRIRDKMGFGKIV